MHKNYHPDKQKKIGYCGYPCSRAGEDHENTRVLNSIYGSLENRLPQQLIASYLGMTRETLNRVKNSYSKQRHKSK